MGRFRYDPEQNGDQSDQQEELSAPIENMVEQAVAQSDADDQENYETATQNRLEHLIRTARRNKARMPGIHRRRAVRLLEIIMPIFNRRFPGVKVHNYQSIPPPPAKKPSF